MDKHPYFNLYLHDDDELCGITGKRIHSRAVLREWPLSRVERITFSDASTLIYKAQCGLPTEIAFYSQVRSSLIPRIDFAQSQGEHHWILMEDVAGDNPHDLGYDDALNLGEKALALIEELSVAGPYRYDLSGDGVDDFAAASIALLEKLRQENQFRIDDEEIKTIKEAFGHPQTRRTCEQKCSFLHGDLKCDNLIIRPDGQMTLIDWQLSLFGPPLVDLYSFMATQGHDPVPIAGIGPELMRLMLEIRWFADCRDNWMKDAVFLDGVIIKIIEIIRHVLDHNGYEGREAYYFH